jgi:hypothetical protein
MKTKILHLASKTNSLGTSVNLFAKDGSYEVCLVTGLETDPLSNNKSRMTGGYLFRSPNIKSEDWAEMLKTLDRIDGKFSIKAKAYRSSSNDDNKNTEDMVVGLIRFENKDDAAIFAWANVEKWQKWSDAQEKDAQKEFTRKPTKLTITKDGRLVGKISVTTLDC